MNINTYLNDIINLKDIANLINILGKTNEIDQVNINNIQYNGKNYIIFKDKNNFLMKSSDGRGIEYKIDIKDAEYGKYYNNIKIMMDLLNGGVLFIYKKILCNNKIDLASFNIFEGNYKLFYISNDDNYQLNWNEKDEMFNYGNEMTNDDSNFSYFDGKDKYTIPAELNENGKKQFVDQIKSNYQETIISKDKDILKQEINLNKIILDSLFSKEELKFVLNYLDDKLINSKNVYRK